MSIDVIARIQAKAAARRHAERAADAAAWARVKTEAPEMADFIQRATAAFGKPEAIRVEIRGEVVLEKGEFA